MPKLKNYRPGTSYGRSIYELLQKHTKEGMCICTCGRSDLSSKEEEEGGGQCYLESQEQEKCFYAVEPSIHKVAHEEVVGLRHVPAHLGERGRL